MKKYLSKKNDWESSLLFKPEINVTQGGSSKDSANLGREESEPRGALVEAARERLTQCVYTIPYPGVT